MGFAFEGALTVSAFLRRRSLSASIRSVGITACAAGRSGAALAAGGRAVLTAIVRATLTAVGTGLTAAGFVLIFGSAVAGSSGFPASCCIFCGLFHNEIFLIQMILEQTNRAVANSICLLEWEASLGCLAAAGAAAVAGIAATTAPGTAVAGIAAVVAA